MKMFRAVLADDEPRILQALERRVDWHSIGIEIAGTATDGPSALELVRTTFPDLLITDIRMPGINGIEVAHAARTYCPTIEIILISGFSEFKYAQEGIELGVLGYLLKPIQQDELNELLRRATDTLKGKRDAIDPGWYQFRSFIARAQASGRLYDHMIEDGILQSGDSLFCMLTTGTPDFVHSHDHRPVYRKMVGPHITACLVSGTRQFCADNRLAMRNYHRLRGRFCGISTTITHPSAIEQTIFEAESAFVRAIFTEQAGVVEYTRADPDLGPLIQDAIKSIQREQYDSLFSLLKTLATKSEHHGSNLESLYYLYNSLVLQTRNYYSLTPATGLLPRPLNGVIDLAFRFPSRTALHTEIEKMANYLRISDVRTGKTDGNSMFQVREYIENHFSEDLSMANLSEIFDLDAGQLSQRFKRVHGWGVPEFVRKTRIGHAKFLLTTTNMAITTVGELCGYSDYFYFARVFKRETGYTCTQFRDENKV